MRPKLSISASKGAGNAAQAAGENSGPRHDQHHVRPPFFHGEPPRQTVQPDRGIREPLAPVLRQGIPSLPAGTALYARPGSGLARQADGVLGPASTRSSPLSRPRPLLGPPALFEAPDACALKRCARPWCPPDGAF